MRLDPLLLGHHVKVGATPYGRYGIVKSYISWPQNKREGKRDGVAVILSQGTFTVT